MTGGDRCQHQPAMIGGWGGQKGRWLLSSDTKGVALRPVMATLGNGVFSGPESNSVSS